MKNPNYKCDNCYIMYRKCICSDQIQDIGCYIGIAYPLHSVFFSGFKRVRTGKKINMNINIDHQRRPYTREGKIEKNISNGVSRAIFC